MLERHIGNYHFVADAKTGITLRWGKTLEADPDWAPVPELADISISNHCTKGCSFCYKDSKPNHEFIRLDDYCHILDSMNHPEYGNVFQVALGGGEPLEHPLFKQIIEATCKRSIVPNFTTNGICLDENICSFIEGKVGAAAISTCNIKDLAIAKIKMLASHEIKTNIHYVLSEDNIDEACDILTGKLNSALEGINALVFLTYKPAGRASVDNTIKDNPKFKEFISLLDDKTIHRPKIGFDACFVPMLLKYTHTRKELIDSCEGAFFSVYIDHNMNVTPCSFSGNKDSYNLRDYDFYDIWDNKFENYRKSCKNKCDSKCDMKSICRGACPYYPEITLCHE